MNKIILFLLSFASVAIISSCSNAFSSHDQPDNLIPKDTMVEMIAEQLIFESTLDFVKQEIEREDTNLYQHINHMLGDEIIPIDSFQTGSMHMLSKLSGAYYNHWLHERNYTYEQYEQSLIYYFNTAETTEEIMNKVKEHITQKYGKSIPTHSPSHALPN